MPHWTEHVIWWHVYPLGFLGADTTGEDLSPAPRLARLELWLDYLIALGANGIALGPVFRSSTHGYDTIDYFEVDPRLGTNADLEHFIDAAHSRGIRVMLDGVFNHVGRGFPLVQASLDDPAAREGAFFRRTDSGDLEVFEGHGGLVSLNHDNPEVADYVTAVMTHWLARGVDAWRLDAAYSVPTTFWASVLPRVRAQHPDVYILGEVLHADYSAVVRGGTLDSVTQYELWQAIWHSLAEANFFELDWALKRHSHFLEAFVPYTFVGNHDVTRIASQIDDERHRAHALVLLFTLGGTPSVYYGDERGLEGIKEERFGGDDAIRPAYPASASSWTAGGEGVLALHRDLIGFRRRQPWLHRATSTAVELSNTHYVFEVAAGSDKLLVALNIGDDALRVGRAGSGRPAEVLIGDAEPSDGAVVVPPHGWAVVG